MTVAVVGAGLAGCVAALELASKSVDVVLVEGNPSVMDGASRFNEGKIHLGYVYAKDPDGRTVELMQQGASSFVSILSRHLPSGLARVRTSRPFDYVVHPESQLAPHELGRSYEDVERRMAELGFHQNDHDYLDRPREQTPRWRDEAELVGLGLSPGGGLAAYATEERALDPAGLADEVAIAVQQSPVDLRCGATVTNVSRSGRGFWIDTSAGRMGPFESVINASWASRGEIDRTVGLVESESWNFRFKYFLRVHKPGIGRSLGSLTWAIGPFGDVVGYGDDLAYLSWYPAGRVHWRLGNGGASLPTAPGRDEADALTANILAGLARLVPEVGRIDPARDEIEVRGGPIVGNGRTDIDDPESGLHRRDNIGVVSRDGYHSISSGKLTTAAMVGERAASAVLAGVNG